MTIEQRILEELDRLQKSDAVLEKKTRTLHEDIEKIIAQVRDHLSEISTQMPEYDKHDASHSEKVLENIEKLLRDQGISTLTLLEAMVLRLCCYFHDTGMILPVCYEPLLRKIELDPKADPTEGLECWLAGQGKMFANVSDQFYCPESQDEYLEFLGDQLTQYQEYRLGLPAPLEDLPTEEYLLCTRHDYLRMTHGDRAGEYAKSLARFLTSVSYKDRKLADAVGEICASHCRDISSVREMDTDLEIIDVCPEMRCNVRYLAMLLRLGDVIHFSADRASRTLYAERAPMGEISDQHWKVKFGDLHYSITPSGKSLSIAYYCGFKDPKAFYFLQNHLNWVDEELRHYASFVSDMHDREDGDRYALGLPTEVVRKHIEPSGFDPDKDLKFRLEHQKIINLLMGMRLYRDEFMCLRELYQNALDACRCMRAENRHCGLTGDLEVEFGLGTDSGGDYLYCRDQGTGMTMDIVKNYLLRIGNSYYQSAEFRRANAQWGGVVAPVSEFGIGLLSCYMIAHRIEVITRHHTRVSEPPIWLCMEGGDDYGYFRTSNIKAQEKWLGRHGTIVKLYLKEEFKARVTGFIPDNPRNAVFIQGRCDACDYDPDKDENVRTEVKESVRRFRNSLYHQVQQFVHVPEEGIPVWIRGDGKREKLFRADGFYDLASGLQMLQDTGVDFSEILFGASYIRSRTIFGKKFPVSDTYAISQTLKNWLEAFEDYPYVTDDPESGAAARVLLRLPRDPAVEYDTNIYSQIDFPVSGRRDHIYINGMPVDGDECSDNLLEAGIHYSFSGEIRPRLSVDRGTVREVPAAVIAVRDKLHTQIVTGIIRQIREHFAKHPAALTVCAQRYLIRYLVQKFDSQTFEPILRELSRDVLRDLPLLDVPLYCWFHEPTVEIPLKALSEADSRTENIVCYSALRNATRIHLNGDKVFVQTEIKHIHEREAPAEKVGSFSLCAEGLPEIFDQYDAVCAYPGLIPRRVFSLLPASENSVSKDLEFYGSILKISFMRCMDPVCLDTPDWHDILYMLRETPGSHHLYRCGYMLPFIEEGSRRYVLYMYVDPRPLTEEDEEFLNRYCADVPAYREGVEKGWSILFYNYKNGVTIAPGKVSRQEILKKLPKEALEHDDGMEYYFTDDTFAF